MPFSTGASCKTIANSAFYGCKALIAITLPEGLTAIGESAFYNCSSVVSALIPSTVTTIGRSAFYNSAKGIIFSEGIKKIPDSACDGANTLEKVSIPSGVEEIGDRAFASLKCKEINLPETLKTLGSYVFDDSDLQKVTIPSSLKTAGNQILTNCKYVEELNINCPLKAFGEYDFFSYYTDSNVSSYGKKLVINTAEPLYPFKYISTMMAFDKVIINEPCSSSDFNMKNGTSDMEQRGFQNIYYEIKDNTISFEYVADVSYKNGKSSLVELNFKK